MVDARNVEMINMKNIKAQVMFIGVPIEENIYEIGFTSFALLDVLKNSSYQPKNVTFGINPITKEYCGTGEILFEEVDEAKRLLLDRHYIEFLGI